MKNITSNSYFVDPLVIQAINDAKDQLQDEVAKVTPCVQAICDFAATVGAPTIPEAPIDSKTYGRKNATWVEVSAGGEGIPWGKMIGQIDDQLDLKNALASKLDAALFTPEAIKHQYELNADTNAFTDNDLDKLANIEAGAEVNTLNSIVAGSNILIDVTDPLNPIISSIGGGAGGGDMYKAQYDPTNIEGDVFDRAIQYGEQPLSSVTNLVSELNSKIEAADLSLSTTDTQVVIGNTGGTGVTLTPSTNTTAGIMTAIDNIKLTSIESGAQVNTVSSVNGAVGEVVLTAESLGALSVVNLSAASVIDAVTINNSAGATAVINAATETHSGVMSGTDKAKLDSIDEGAEVNTVISVNGLTGAVEIPAGVVIPPVTTDLVAHRIHLEATTGQSDFIVPSLDSYINVSRGIPFAVNILPPLGSPPLTVDDRIQLVPDGTLTPLMLEQANLKNGDILGLVVTYTTTGYRKIRITNSWSNASILPGNVDVDISLLLDNHGNPLANQGEVLIDLRVVVMDDERVALMFNDARVHGFNDF